MDGNTNNTGKELDKVIFTHLKSILQPINTDFDYGAPRLWIEYSKWSIGDTGCDMVTNAQNIKSNLSYNFTGRCDVNIIQTKTKL